MQLRLSLIIALSAVSFTGCQHLSFNNGSLDYKNTKTLEPLKYPEGSHVRSATALYPAPVVDQLAVDHAPQLTNASNNRFELPRPSEFKLAPSTSTVSSHAPVTIQGTTSSRPQPVSDGNLNPLLKIDGDTKQVWQYTLAALSALNYKVLEQSKDSMQVMIQFKEQRYLVRLNSIGSSNHLAILNRDNSFADHQVAADLLIQIYQNWPA